MFSSSNMNEQSNGCSNCSNCTNLYEQCAQLREEVKLLNDRIDKLTSMVFCETSDNATQTIDTLFCSKLTQTECALSVETQTDTGYVPNTSDILFDIFQSESEINNPADLIVDNVLQPCALYSDQPFAQFSLLDLDQATTNHYKTFFQNRLVAYYGKVPYRYGGVCHEAQPFGNNPYLAHIVSHLQTIMPDFIFNSALITKYRNGKDYIGFHSDNESELKENSEILTVSLGETRVIQYTPKDNSKNNTCAETSFSLIHGSMFSMSKESQSLYQHSIPKDYSNRPRISITFRNISETKISLEESPKSSIDPHDQPETMNLKQHTVYISSSMFRDINPNKMSTGKQKATVLCYPGATAGRILQNLQEDGRFTSIQSEHVTKVFLMCGTNNIDKILHIPRSQDKSIVEQQHTQFNSKLLNNTKCEMEQLISFLQHWAHTASINVINILPRTSATRNQVINKLNQFILEFCSDNENLNFVGTEKQRNLFCFKNGHRKSDFFKSQGHDNVHLNALGVSRLAKHLKYLAHL